MAEFEIGATLETLTNVQELAVPLVPPKSQFMPYARTVNLGSGGKRGVGFPVAIWEFALITIEERNQLKTFCVGASEAVYIHTKRNDDTYANYSATMIWPEGIEDRWYGEKRNFTIVFRNLVEIEGS